MNLVHCNHTPFLLECCLQRHSKDTKSAVCLQWMFGVSLNLPPEQTQRSTKHGCIIGEFPSATLGNRLCNFGYFYYTLNKDNWANLSTYFKYPEAVRRLIYTTNAIEGFNRQLRKVTKSKTVFPSDDSLLKMLYLAMMDITKKWTGHRQDWGQIHSQLEIFFEERLSGL